jgi:hypothetical protein
MGAGTEPTSTTLKPRCRLYGAPGTLGTATNGAIASSLAIAATDETQTGHLPSRRARGPGGTCRRIGKTGQHVATLLRNSIVPPPVPIRSTLRSRFAWC